MIVSPSLLAADKSDLAFEAMKMKEAGASHIHIDIMDAHFVPAFTWDASIVSYLKERTSGLVLDTHLMIIEPEKHVDEYIDAGANILTVHYEAFPDKKVLAETLKHIASRGVKPGLSIKPMTDAKEIEEFLPYCSLILVMTVEPGKGGQSFIESQLEDIAKVKAMLKAIDSDAQIEVDGGINEKTGRFCRDFGADILVAGSYLFGHEDYKERLEGLLDL